MASAALTTLNKDVVGFDPRSIGGCQLWLDASDRNTIISSGGRVSRWIDKSGAGNDGTANTTNRPYDFPTDKAIAFYGSGGGGDFDNRLLTNLSGSTQVESIFLVARKSDVVNPTNTTALGSSPGGRQFGVTPTSIGLAKQANYVIYNFSISNSGTFYLCSSADQGLLTVGNGYSANSATAYLNGTSVGSNAATSNNVAYTAGFTSAVGNTINVTGAGFSQSLCEIIVYQNVILTTQQRQAVEGYLAWKWDNLLVGTGSPALTRTIVPALPATQPYKSISPFGTTFTPLSVSNCNLWLDATERSSFSLGTSRSLTYSSQFIQLTPQTITYTGTVQSVNDIYAITSPWMAGAFIAGGGGNFIVGSAAPSSTPGQWYAWCLELGFIKVVKFQFALTGATLTVVALSAGYTNVSANFLLTTNTPVVNDQLYASYTSQTVATVINGSGYGVRQFTMAYVDSDGTNTVGVWKDKSGNGRDMTLANTSPTYTTNVINSLPVVRFDGVSNRLNNITGLGLSNGPMSIFMLERNLGGISGSAIISFDTTGPNSGIVIQNNGGTLQPFTGITYTSATARIDYYNRTNTGTGTSVTFLNGSSVVCQDDSTGTYPNLFSLGIRIVGTIYGSGDLGEIIIYSKNLTGTERQQVEGYLAQKWGLRSSLAVTQPFRLYLLPQAPLFLPTALSTSPNAWYDGRDPNNNVAVIPLDGATVSTWTDKSGNSLNGTGVNNPTYSFTNKAIQFVAASTQYYTTTLTASAASETVILVAETSSSGAIYTLLGASAANGRVLRVNATNFIELLGTAQTYTSSSTITTGSRFILAVTYNASASGVTMRINGTSQIIANVNAVTLSASNTFIGATVGPTNYFNGFIYEIIPYSASVLGLNDIQRVEGYLAWKWGLNGNLPVTHPYYKIKV